VISFDQLSIGALVSENHDRSWSHDRFDQKPIKNP